MRATNVVLFLCIVINMVAEIKVLKTWLVTMKSRNNNNVETFKGNLFITDNNKKRAKITHKTKYEY